jgi:hypothetical protein
MLICRIQFRTFKLLIRKMGLFAPYCLFAKKIAQLIWLVQAETEIVFLHKSRMFKWKINVDRRSPRLVRYATKELPDPPHF